MPRPIVYAVCCIVTQMTVNYIGVCITALTFENGLKFLASTYYFLLVFMILALIVTQGAGLLRYSKNLERKAMEAKPKDEKKAQ